MASKLAAAADGQESAEAPAVIDGIATEAEPGRIEGGEDGVKDTAELEGMMTTSEDVDDFVATGIDFLAPAFGNVHGDYHGVENIHLDYDR